MSHIIETTYKKVQTFLQQMYGATYQEKVSEFENKFVIAHGSAAVIVSVKPWHETECIVEALSYVVHGASMSPELMSFLLRENSKSPFGAFGTSFDNTITYSHAITGSHLDQNELATTVRHVAFMADEYDDIIRSRAGGKRAVDGGATILSDVSVAATKRTAPPAPKKRSLPKAKKQKIAVKKSAVKKKAPAKKKTSKPAPKKKGKR